jgi:hypothetical protein
MNEPVAWMREDGVIAFHKQKEVDSQGYKWQPLYTHPVKELTDEEIMALWKVKHPNVMSLNPDLLEFAREILRKAQEK